MNKQFNIGEKLLLTDMQVGMIVDLLPYNQINNYYSFKDAEITSVQPPFGIDIKHKNMIMFVGNITDYHVVFKGYVEEGYQPETPTTSSQQQSPLDEQSITEAIKTLSRASEELSTHIIVDKKGDVTIYSDYHEEELVFCTAEKLVQYMECVKQMNSFSKENNNE